MKPVAGSFLLFNAPGGSNRWPGEGESVLLLSPVMWLNGPKGSGAWAGLAESETPSLLCPQYLKTLRKEGEEETRKLK